MTRTTDPVAATDVVRVRKWIAANRKIIFVFVGDSVSANTRAALAQVAEESGGRSGVNSKSKHWIDGVVPSSWSELERRFGPQYRDVLGITLAARERSELRFVRASIFADDSLKEVKHKLMSFEVVPLQRSVRRSIGDGDDDGRDNNGDGGQGEQQTGYHDVYLWAEQKQGQGQDEQQHRPGTTNTVMTSLLRDVFRDRMTCPKHELLQNLNRVVYGVGDDSSASASASATRSPPMTKAHAERFLIDRGGIPRTTLPLGLAYEFGDYRVLFDHHPFRSPIAMDPDFVNKDGTPKPMQLELVTADETILQSVFDVHDPVATLDVVTLDDLERHAVTHASKTMSALLLRRGFVARYFPVRLGVDRTRMSSSLKTGPGLPSVHQNVMDDYAALTTLRSTTTGKNEDDEKNKKKSNSRPSSSLTAADSGGIISVRVRKPFPGVSQLPLSSFDDVFNALRGRNSQVPLVMMFDGVGNTFRVSRMSLHKNLVDVNTVIKFLNNRARMRMTKTRPYILFVLHSIPSDGGSVQCRFFANGELDATIGFSILKPGTPDAVQRGIDLINRYVVATLDKILTPIMTSALHPLDSSVVTAVDRPSPYPVLYDTRVFNVETTWLQPAPRERTPRLREVAARMAAMPAVFSLVLPIAEDGVLTAYYKRTRVASGSIHWVAHMHALSANKLVSRDQAAVLLARAFGTSQTYAAFQLERYHSGGLSREKFLLMSLTRQAGLSTVTLRLSGQNVYRITTNSVHQGVELQSLKHAVTSAIRSAATGEDSHSYSNVVPAAPGGPSPSLLLTDTGRMEDQMEDQMEEIDYGESEGDGIYDGIGARDADLDLEQLLSSSGEDISSLTGTTHSSSSPLSSPYGSSQRDDVVDSLTSDDGKAGNNDDVLRALQRADPDLFSNRNSDGIKRGKSYAAICGAVDVRQPIVISEEERARMERERPGSSGHAIAYGSTPERRANNRYICPKVWCPKSRIAMTSEEFERAGKRCPVPDVDEKPIVFDNNYWNGKPRHPGFLDSKNHPAGLCMPCCFTKQFNNFDKCLVSDAEDTPTAGRDEDDVRYIMGETSLPLTEGRLGMIPRAIQAAFHGTQDTRHGEHVLLPGQCGKADNGSGQFTSTTNCFVRRGVARGKQNFLNSVLDLLRKDLPAEVTRDTRSFVRYVCDNLQPHVFLAMNQGMVARLFMPTEASTASTKATVEERRHFESAFLASTEYHKVMNLQDVVKLLRTHARTRSTGPGGREDPRVVRENLIFSAFERFKAYMLDTDVVKTHTVCLSLFNMGLTWLNPRGVNIVVLEKKLSSAISTDNNMVGGGDKGRKKRGGGIGVASVAVEPEDVVLDCQGVRRDDGNFRLTQPFAFIVKQGAFYEPVHHVKKKRVDGGYSVKSSMTYAGSSTRVRAFLDTVIRGCRAAADHSSGRPEGFCSSATCMLRFLRRSLGQSVRAQVVDHTFNLKGFVSDTNVYVPLLRKESILVGPSAPDTIMYLEDVADLQPTTTSPLALITMFNSLSELAGDDRYAVDHVIQEGQGQGKRIQGKGRKGVDGNSSGGGESTRVIAIQLRSGSVIPVSLAAARGMRSTYLESLNIMIGRQLPDTRVMYMDGIRGAEKRMTDLRRDVAAVLQERTDLLNEYVFLRSAFNPFPFWYRRARMRGLVESLSLRAEHADIVIGLVVDHLLFGPDLYQQQHSSLRRRSSSNIVNDINYDDEGRGSGSGSLNPDITITDADISRGDGEWVTRIQRVAADPLSSEALDPAGDVAGTRDEVRNGAKEVGRRTRDLMLSSACSSNSPSTLTPGNKNKSTGRTSSARRRTNPEPYVVGSCDMWQLFYMVSVLVSPAGKGSPPWMLRLAVANGLARPSAVSVSPGGGELLLRRHPQHERILAATDKGAEGLCRLTRSSEYSPSLFDVAVMARFCYVRCEVLVGGPPAGAVGPASDVLSASNRTTPPMYVFNDDDIEASATVKVVYHPSSSSSSSESFDVIVNGNSLLFPPKTKLPQSDHPDRALFERTKKH